jgi:DNA mismatch repair protein MSH6
MLVVFL